MTLKVITTACSLAMAAMFGATPAYAQFSGNTIKIGIVTDMSGVYADIDGAAGVAMVRRAVKDFGGTLDGKKIEVVYADHQNKADIAASKAREWFDTEGVDMLIGGTTSSTSLAMSDVAKEKKKVFISIGAGTSALTNEQCSPYTIHWAYDTVALAKGTGGAVVKAGGKTWFFITADYAFGTALQADTSKVVEATGGKVLGSVKVPLGASDFSSYLLQAQNSGAQILGMANAGGDTINTIKQANEFGITKKMKLAGLLLFITDINSLGLEATQGMYMTSSWYWNRDAETRAWSQPFFKEFKRMPTSVQAADYSATLEYLRAVKAVGTD
ncbi:MAG: ABC transporter substrate-binding protein, partial [Ramlibacter sp.]|nr:ABC transporter substrate-binding protein [Ramlibacter sp.]